MERENCGMSRLLLVSLCDGKEIGRGGGNEAIIIGIQG